MESMVALMTVTVVLLLFMSILSGYTVNEERQQYIDVSFVKELRIHDGVITGDVNQRLASISERYGYDMVVLSVESVDPFIDCHKEFSYGERIGDDMDSITGTVQLESDDGRTAVAAYKVMLWR